MTNDEEVSVPQIDIDSIADDDEINKEKGAICVGATSPGFSSKGNRHDCKCLLCSPNTYHCKGSLTHHLNDVHNTGRKLGETYVNIDENGEETGKKRGYGTLPSRETKCLLCDWVGTEKGITYHLKHLHQQGQKKGVNFEFTGNTVQLNSEAPQKRYSSDKKPQVITPQGGYVDVAVILRIPIVLGQVKIQGNQ